MAGHSQCRPEFTWALNSLGQNPCVVNDILQGSSCVGEACANCQGRPIVAWSLSSADCQPRFLSEFPLQVPPSDITIIPPWAYLDVTESDGYDPLKAEANATATPTGSNDMPDDSLTVTASPTDESTSLPSTTKTSSISPKTGAIAGGIIGAFVLFATVATFVVWYIRRRRMLRAPSAMYRAAQGAQEIVPNQRSFLDSPRSQVISSPMRKTKRIPSDDQSSNNYGANAAMAKGYF